MVIESKNNNNLFAKWVVIGFVIVVAIFALVKYQAKKDCEFVAQKASVEEFSNNIEPDSSRRDLLQRGYEQKYKEINC